MTRFLAIIRRLFLGGIVSLIVCLSIGIGLKKMFDLCINFFGIRSVYSIFFMSSPILFLLFTFLSATYVRKYGQFAEIHGEQPYITTVFRCLGHDLISPFKNIIQFIGALFNKDAIGRGLLILRFVELVVLVAMCAIGVFLLR